MYTRVPEHGARAALVVAALFAGLAGCADLASRQRLNPFRRPVPLVLDRPSDLIPPEGLRVTTELDRSIGLAWDPVLVGDVAGYAILRAQDPAQPFEVVGRTESRFGTVFIDRGEREGELGDGEAYHYRVHPYDPQRRVSRSHAHVSATTEPAPDVPGGLRAYSNLPRRVVLAWEPNERVSTSGYVVMRSPTVAGPWERVHQASGRLDTVYDDTVPGDLRVMYYRVVAHNRFGGESDQTEPVRAVTKAEPLAPIGLEVEGRRLGAIDIRWAPNVEPDLRAYEVWRSTGEGPRQSGEKRIATLEPTETRYEDREVECGQAVRYRLRAVDADSLTSGYSETLATRGEEIGLELLAVAGGAQRLRWDRQRTVGWPTVRVMEVRAGLPDRELAAETNASEAVLAGLEPGTRQLAVLLSERPANASGAGAGPVRRCEITVRVP